MKPAEALLITPDDSLRADIAALCSRLGLSVQTAVDVDEVRSRLMELAASDATTAVLWDEQATEFTPEWFRQQLFRGPILCLVESGQADDESKAVWSCRKDADVRTWREKLNLLRPLSHDQIALWVNRGLALAARQIEWLQDNLGRLLSREQQLEIAGMIDDAIREVAASPGVSGTMEGREWKEVARRLQNALQEDRPVSEEDRTTCWQVGGEVEIRQAEKLSAQAKSALHKLNGRLRNLSSGALDWTPKLRQLLDRLAPFTARRQTLGDVIQRANAQPLLDNLYLQLCLCVREGRDANAVRETLQQHVEALAPFFSWASFRTAPSQPAPGGYKWILVVEDDPGWRADIQHAIRIAAADDPAIAVLKVNAAEDETQARAHLQESRQAGIVLFDLGLPSQYGLRDVSPEKGLALLRDWRELRPQDYVLVLTAAENYPRAVDLAVGAGVQPHDYVLKTPGEWETELLFRLHFALHRVFRPRVEVFQSTGCRIRVGGVEVDLEETPFCVFEYLASKAAEAGRPHWLSADEIQNGLSRLPLEPYPGCGRDVGEMFDGREPSRIADDIYSIRKSLNTGLRRVQSGVDARSILATRDGNAASPARPVRLMSEFDEFAEEAIGCPLAVRLRRRDEQAPQDEDEEDVTFTEAWVEARFEKAGEIVRYREAVYEDFHKEAMPDTQFDDQLENLKARLTDRGLTLGKRPRESSPTAQYAVHGEVNMCPTFEAKTTASAPSPVLTVEDDDTWLQDIVTTLSAKGFQCLPARSLNEAKRLIAAHSPRLVSLDLMIPEENGGPADEVRGPHVLDYLKAQDWADGGREVRVAVLTSLDVLDRLKLNLLGSGVHLADVHIKGPLGVRRLVNSLCRLSQELERGSLFAGGETPEQWPIVHLKAAVPNAVWIDDHSVRLTEAQYKIIRLLARHRNRAVHREEIKKLLWPETYDGADDAPERKELNGPLDNHLNRLRQAIREQTGGDVDPHRLIGGRSALWLQAIVKVE